MLWQVKNGGNNYYSQLPTITYIIGKYPKPKYAIMGIQIFIRPFHAIWH